MERDKQYVFFSTSSTSWLASFRQFALDVDFVSILVFFISIQLMKIRTEAPKKKQGKRQRRTEMSKRPTSTKLWLFFVVYFFFFLFFSLLNFNSNFSSFLVSSAFTLSVVSLQLLCVTFIFVILFVATSVHPLSFSLFSIALLQFFRFDVFSFSPVSVSFLRCTFHPWYRQRREKFQFTLFSPFSFSFFLFHRLSLVIISFDLNSCAMWRSSVRFRSVFIYSFLFHSEWLWKRVCCCYSPFPETMVLRMAFEMCCCTNEEYQMTLAKRLQALRKLLVKTDCRLHKRNKKREWKLDANEPIQTHTRASTWNRSRKMKMFKGKTTRNEKKKCSKLNK